MSTKVNGVSRVTIVAPKTRMDLALPSDVPLAQLLPTVIRQIGDDLADEGAANGGWVLSRLGARPFDSARTATQLDILDGELLYFTPRSAARPEVVFDDVVDAVATATKDRSGKWVPATSRRFSVGLAAATFTLGALLLLLNSPPQAVNGALALVLATVLVVVAALLSRAGGDSRSGVVMAMTAMVHSFVGGLLVLAGDRTVGQLGAAHILLGGTALLLAAAVSAVAVGDAAPAFLGVIIAALALIVGALLALFSSPAPAAATIAAIFFAAHPMLPMLAYRLARVPIPSVPTGPEDLKTDAETVNGQRVLELSDRADDFLTGLIWTVSVVVLGALVPLALDGQLRSIVFCLVMALLLMLRARPFASRRERIPSLLAGTTGLGLTAVSVFLAAGSSGRLLLAVGGLILVAAISLGYGLIAGRRIAPVWGRVLDILEILLILAVVPLAAWVCGLYSWISNIAP